MNSINFDKTLIAPCGINCGTCMAYQRDKNRCHGCSQSFLNKKESRVHCRIKNCEHLKKSLSGYCYDCNLFPCKSIKHIDKRYGTRYRASLIQNLMMLKEAGMEHYLTMEAEKWACPSCGAVTSIHRFICPGCNKPLNSFQDGTT